MKPKKRISVPDKDIGSLIDAAFTDPEARKTLLMMADIERKNLAIITPMLIEILSYFKCPGCGECCTDSPPGMNDEELEVIARRVGQEAYDALDETIMVNAFRIPCHFRSDKGCRIYEIRPTVCKIYPFSEKNIGVIMLVLCPLGYKIVEEFNDCLLFYGKPKVNFIHNEEAQKIVDENQKIFEMVGYGQRKSSHTLEVAFNYAQIEKFLKYLRQKKRAGDGGREK